MLSVNLKSHRKAKGLTQEELAIRLNVVRQTVSKWEKGQSVPDADLLIRMSEIFEVPVSGLLGAELENDKKISDVAEQLSRINEQLAIINRRARRVWKTVTIVFAAIIVIGITIVVMNLAAYNPALSEHMQAFIAAKEAKIIRYNGVPLDDVTLEVGDSFTLDKIEGAPLWESGNTFIFVVSDPETGTITAVGHGVATLTAIIGDKRDTCIIRVP